MEQVQQYAVNSTQSPTIQICTNGYDCSNPADVNNDGNVNVIDLALVIYWQGTTTSPGDDYSHLDVTGDGFVN